MSVLTLSAPFSQSSVASLLASCVHLLAMSVSYTFQPTLARHAVKCCFPRKTAEPPKVPIAADEPKDDSFDPTVYLLNLQVSLDGSKIAVVTSNAEVRVYASESISLISQMTGHSATVTDVKFSDSDANVLVTSSDDGSVCVWDVKTGAKTATYTVQGENFKSVAIAGHILAAGTASGQIHFWDLQSGSQQVLADYFSQDVTQLIFHPGNRAHLCAGSYDGLVCLIDTSIPLDDDAILDVLNVGTSVAKMGLFGPENQFLYTLAPTEQLQVWSLENSSKVSDFGFELREHLSSLCSEEINYIIDCKYDYESSTLLLFAGSFSGLISVFSVSADNNFHFLTKLKGHSAIVRDIWFAPHGCTAVTIGEDSMLHYWTSADGSNLGSAKPASEPNFSSTQRTKPY